jgi:hypothetical protein
MSETSPDRARRESILLPYHGATRVLVLDVLASGQLQVECGLT